MMSARPPPRRPDPAGPGLDMRATKGWRLIMMAHEAIHGEELLVHDWRVDRLIRLGVPGSLAQVYADRLDWHQVARLVQRGCPPRLALRIVV
jgi:hypothetical protein